MIQITTLPLAEVRGFEKQMFGAISLPSARILANGL